MGFWQGLCESYDKNADVLKRMYPLSTTTISNNGDFIAVIVIDNNGVFQKAEKIEKKKGKEEPRYITIPVTESSAGRTSKPDPHPLFDQFDYVKGNGAKFEKYIALLKEFSESKFATDAVRAIYTYISKKTVEKDLGGLKPKNKTNVVFNVEISSSNLKTWEDEKVFEAWHNFYLDKKNASTSAKITLDYISGKEQLEADSHPKKIVNSSGNAKLISDNDKDGFTFRGKFDVIFEGTGKDKKKIANEALSIGYESSQKAHQFLRYLMNDRGICCDEQVILSYTIGDLEKLPEALADSKSVYSVYVNKCKDKTEIDEDIKTRARTGFDYSEALSKALRGYHGGNALNKHERTAVVVLDAATTGRLAVTFYRELDKHGKYGYLERVADWHDTCKWHFNFFVEKQYCSVVETPSVDKIIEAVYGKPRSGQDASYNKIKKQAREQLMRCIFDGMEIPKSYIFNATHRVSNPLSITKSNGKFDKNSFETMLSTTCALIKKFYKKESYQMSLERGRRDRDYLYGRLLGAADKLESYALYKNEKDRPTNAIRLMNAFSQKPFTVWNSIHNKIFLYLSKGGFAVDEIQSINELFKEGEFELDKPLNTSYLLGFYHERAEIERRVKERNLKNSEKNINQEEGINA